MLREVDTAPQYAALHASERQLQMKKYTWLSEPCDPPVQFNCGKVVRQSFEGLEEFYGTNREGQMKGDGVRNPTKCHRVGAP